MTRYASHGVERFSSPFLVALLLSGTGLVAANAAVQLPDPASECVQWAAGEISITANVWALHGIAKVLLWYKSLPSDANWTSVTMTRDGDAYAASVRLPPAGMLYLVEAHDTGGSGIEFPNALKTVPYVVVEPWEIN